MPPKTIHNAPPVSRCFKMFQDSCHIQAHPGGWVLKQHLGQLCSIESSPGKAITSAPCTSNYCSNMDSWIVRMWFWGPRRSNAQYLALLILSVVRHCVAWHWWNLSSASPLAPSGLLDSTLPWSPRWVQHLWQRWNPWECRFANVWKL